MAGYFWRLPSKKRARRSTPPPSVRRSPTPLPARPPSERPALPQIAFERRDVLGRTVLVSAECAALRLVELTRVLADHGSAPGSRESKHRMKARTVMVVTNAATGETLVATSNELRLMRGGLGTSKSADYRRRRR